MVALYGFDTFVASAAVTPPLVLSQTLVSVPVPARLTIGGIDVDVDDLDSATVPTIAFDIGDAADVNRFVAADVTAGAGGLFEYRPANTTYYRYNLAGAVNVTVQALPTTAVAGAIAMTLYGYPSLDIADVARMTLQSLAVLAEGETPRAQDATLAIEAINEIHERLRFKGLANRQDLAWPVTLIPVFAGRVYSRMAAELLTDTFGVSAQRAAMAAQRAAEAEREMRRQTQVKTAGGPVNLEPYQSAPPFILDLGVLV